jgi:hypothetical protein
MAFPSTREGGEALRPGDVALDQDRKRLHDGNDRRAQCVQLYVARDLFTPIMPLERTHSLFQHVRQGPGHAAARELMNAIFAQFIDVDGSFIREFQTGGFSARVFELALFAYMQEHDLDLDRSHPAPDFHICGQSPVAVEVTTTNPPQMSDQRGDKGP